MFSYKNILHENIAKYTDRYTKQRLHTIPIGIQLFQTFEEAKNAAIRCVRDTDHNATTHANPHADAPLSPNANADAVCVCTCYAYAARVSRAGHPSDAGNSGGELCLGIKPSHPCSYHLGHSC